MIVTGTFKHPEEFRRRAVEALANRNGRTLEDLEREFKVKKSAIYKWREQFETGATPQPRKAIVTSWTAPGLAELQAERDRLKYEAEALRKTIVLLGGKS